MTDSSIETMLLNEAVLAKDWAIPEEDEAWKSLNDDIELNSPNSLGELFAELRQRGFERINDPRRTPTDENFGSAKNISWLH